jgi:hypothetical protein
MTLSIVFACPHADDVLRRRRRAHRSTVYPAVAVRVDAGVARGERDRHVAMLPDEVISVEAVGRVRAGRVAAPRIRMNACAAVIALLKQLADVARNADEVVAVGQGVKILAEARRGRPVFKGLKNQLRAGRRTFAFARRPTVAQNRGGRVGAVSAIHVYRTVIRNARKTSAGGAGPVEDC